MTININSSERAGVSPARVSKKSPRDSRNDAKDNGGSWPHIAHSAFFAQASKRIKSRQASPMQTMKLSLLSILATAVVGLVAASQDVPLPSPQHAIEAVQQINTPAGVKFTGLAEPITQSTETAITPTHDNNKEQWVGGGRGGLGWGGWGSWGGWGGFGPYRFGYACGGLTGWAYPLGYWNAFGSGLWGGGCGLGIPYGGLFYC